MTEEEVNRILAQRLEVLEKLRNDPKLLQAAMTHYSDNPVDFINDWMITYDPRVVPAMIPFILFPKQADYINWLKERWERKEDGLTEKSRDMGVTWLCCAFAAWLWIFHDGASISFGSRKEDLVDKVGDPDSIFEKIRIIIDKLPQEFIPQSFDRRQHASHMKILNPENGANIKGESGDNIGRGGRSSIYFKDESAFYERPEKIEAALSMNSDVKIDVSTPNGNGNPFYRKRHEGKIPVFTFRWQDDPRKDDDWYRKQKNILDPVILAQEVDIDYNASVGDALIDAEDVLEARRMRYESIFDERGNEAPLILGVDVARFGDDRTVFCARQGRQVHWFQIFRQLDTMQVAGEVLAIVRETHFDAIFVDVVGIGAGVYDRLAEELDQVFPVNVGADKVSESQIYYNKRAECWGRMNQWIKDKPVILPNSDEMQTDLCSLKYSFNGNGQLVLEKKEDAKKRGVRSPDLGDALALTFAESVSHYSEWDNAPTYHEGRSSVTGY